MKNPKTAHIGLFADGGKIQLRVTYSASAPVDEAGMTWLDGECSFVVGPINGRFQLYLTQCDLESMRANLEQLLAGSAGTEASLETMEQDIVLRCTVNKRGLTKIDGRINPRNAANVVCTFVFEAGPMDLKSTLLGIEELLCQITEA